MSRIILVPRIICIVMLSYFVVPGYDAFGQQSFIRRVDDDAQSGGNGQSWSTAYRFLKDALAEVNNDVTNPPPTYEIRVARGTYLPDH